MNERIGAVFGTHEETTLEQLSTIRSSRTLPGRRSLRTAAILRGTETADPEVAELQSKALYSTVHGAGRVMSRTQATGKVNRKTGEVIRPGRVTPEMMSEWLEHKGVILRGGGLDESPHVYRRLPHVLEAQGPTVEVLHVLHPVIVVMAGADEFDPYKD